MASERLNHLKPSPWVGEHAHRYEVVLPFVAPTDHILDIATGEGYGAAQMAEQAQSGRVIGADADMEALALAQAIYKSKSNLVFQREDASRLSFADNSFDKIISFETLKHVTDYEAMLYELRRVLKPGGKLILSTPNFPINSPTGVVTNPYHVKEFTLEELEVIMPNYFDAVQFWGQAYSRFDEKSPRIRKTLKGFESILYQRGVRKLPLGLKNALSKALTGRPHYPEARDYALVSDRKRIRTCKTILVFAEKHA
ncbi:MAG: class I SAM-dependent methyltransferase [Sphingobacteriia bacterium]